MPGRDAVYVWIGRAAGDQPEVTRRLLVRAGVALLGRERSEISVRRGAAGRPLVRAGGVPLPVSVSHVDGVVAVAACRDATVGVDVERRRPLPAVGLAERWFAEQPEGLNVVRDDQGLAGFVFHVMHPTGSPMEDRDPVTRAVRLRGAPVALSAKEFSLLHMLASDPTRVFSKAELLRDVWGYMASGNSRTVDAHACRLRRKLSGAGRRYVVNVRGVGYRLTEAA